VCEEYLVLGGTGKFFCPHKSSDTRYFTQAAGSEVDYVMSMDEAAQQCRREANTKNVGESLRPRLESLSSLSASLVPAQLARQVRSTTAASSSSTLP
jgi:hypothetical protein